MKKFRMAAAGLAVAMLLALNFGVAVMPVQALQADSDTPCTDQFGGSFETLGEWCGCMWALYGYEC